jgi:hypothetical protein
VSHKSIRLLIETTARGLADDIQVSYATDTDFNQAKKSSSILINIAPLVAVPSYAVNGNLNYSKAWTSDIAFFKIDNSQAVEYQQILDDTDELVDKFIHSLNFFQAKSSNITITFGTQQSFIKATADILTGWIIPITITPMDDTDYCIDC